METCKTRGETEFRLDPFRTIQIHPTRKCNLSCLHCYSSSAPHLKNELNINALKKFLPYAFEHGFNNISISGGEPFMYSGLEELLIFSKSLGFQNTVASNGMLLHSEKNKRILKLEENVWKPIIIIIPKTKVKYAIIFIISKLVTP